MGTLLGLFTRVKDILEELAGYFEDARMIVYVSLAVAAITLLTHLIFRKIRIMKYLPGLMVLLIGLYNFYVVKDVLAADESMSNLLLFIIGVSAGLTGMLFALIIGIYTKPVKKKKKTKKSPEKKQSSEEQSGNKEYS